MEQVNIVCLLCNGSDFSSVEKDPGYELFVCNECELVVGHSYDRSEYEKEYAKGAYHSKFDTARRFLKGKRIHLAYGPRIFLSQNRSGAGRSLLDVGCGSGTFLLQARQRGFRVHGVEVSQSAVDFVKSELGLAAYCGDLDTVLNDQPQLEGFFDYVSSFEVIEHVPDALAFLQTIKKTLKPGGRLILSTPNWNSAYYRNSRGRTSRPPIHISFWNPNTLRTALERNGFHDIRVYEKPFAVGEFHEKSAIRKALKIANSLILDGVFRRTVGTTMVITAQKP